MKLKYYLLCFTTSCILYASVNGDIASTILDLSAQIYEMQIKKTTESLPPIIWHKEKGLYESDVKMYFHGDSEMHTLRDIFGIFDNNMFATSWITIGLLEAYRYGKAPIPYDEQIDLSVDTISKYSDKNRNYVNSVMTFWPQVYNTTLFTWQCAPQNLLDLFDLTYGENWDLIERILEVFGEDEIVNVIKYFLLTRETYKHAFMIPPDFDDSFVNIGLGAVLKEMSHRFPKAYATWSKYHYNITSVLTALKKYAYRPMSQDSRVNKIDPRTYFHIRKFLENATARGEDIALVPTWVQDTEEVRKMYYKGVDMPININNVDCTVAANAVFGITNGVLTGILNETVLNDPEIQQIYRNTSSLIAFEIQTNFSGRKDLALTYYPSEYEFYWFVARTYSQLEYYANKTKLHPVFEEVRSLFGSVLKGRVTDVLMNSYKVDEEERIYYDDFLGDGDVDGSNRTLTRAEDRIFTTAMAVNALLTIWTVHDDSRQKLVYYKETPFKVIETVREAVNWLDMNALGGQYKPYNTFFSGSVKGLISTNPYFYPMNVFEFLNGTKINDTVNFPRSMDFMFGMQGVQSEEWYEKELQKTRFGVKTPTEFHGYNSDPSFFPFWSSEPYTYVITMLGMAKYRNTVVE